MIWLLVPLIGSLLIWLVSLRRSPWPGSWLIVTAVMAIIGVLEMAATQSDHPTLTGLMAVALASLTPQGFSAFIVESDRRQAEWGAAYRPRPMWEVKTYAMPLNLKYVEVAICLQKSNNHIVVGMADPIAEFDKLMDLQVHAAQRADALNSLGAESWK